MYLYTSIINRTLVRDEKINRVNSVTGENTSALLKATSNIRITAVQIPTHSYNTKKGRFILLDSHYSLIITQRVRIILQHIEQLDLLSPLES